MSLQSWNSTSLLLKYNHTLTVMLTTRRHSFASIGNVTPSRLELVHFPSTKQPMSSWADVKPSRKSVKMSNVRHIVKCVTDHWSLIKVKINLSMIILYTLSTCTLLCYVLHWLMSSLTFPTYTVFQMKCNYFDVL